MPSASTQTPLSFTEGEERCFPYPRVAELINSIEKCLVARNLNSCFPMLFYTGRCHGVCTAVVNIDDPFEVILLVLKGPIRGKICTKLCGFLTPLTFNVMQYPLFIKNHLLGNECGSRP